MDIVTYTPHNKSGPCYTSQAAPQFMAIFLIQGSESLGFRSVPSNSYQQLIAIGRGRISCFLISIGTSITINRIQIHHYPFPTNPILWLFFFNLARPICAANILGVGFHWSMGNLSGATLLKKTVSLSLPLSPYPPFSLSLSPYPLLSLPPLPICLSPCHTLCPLDLFAPLQASHLLRACLCLLEESRGCSVVMSTPLSSGHQG